MNGFELEEKRKAAGVSRAEIAAAFEEYEVTESKVLQMERGLLKIPSYIDLLWDASVTWLIARRSETDSAPAGSLEMRSTG